MKKILAMMLTAAMMLSMGTAAMADDVNTDNPDGPYANENTVTFTKNYRAIGDTAVSPAETFSFVDDATVDAPVENTVKFVNATNTGVGYTEEWAKAKENLPTISTVTYQEGAAGKTNPEDPNAVDDYDKENYMTQDIVIDFPDDYPSVGVYNYTFNEKNNGVAGVTYNDTTMKLVVTVVEQDGETKIASVHCEKSGNKSDEFDNTYTAGTLVVSKTVTGNLGDTNKEFTVTVTFESEKPVNAPIYVGVDANNDGKLATDEITAKIEASEWEANKVDEEITVKNGSSIMFANIPDGVKYTVDETDYTNDGYTTTYTVNGTAVKDENDKVSDTLDTLAETVAIENKKQQGVDTGISVDSIPYIAMLGVVALGGTGLVISKKRRSED